jgi:hypothetical protein
VEVVQQLGMVVKEANAECVGMCMDWYRSIVRNSLALYPTHLITDSPVFNALLRPYCIKLDREPKCMCLTHRFSDSDLRLQSIPPRYYAAFGSS